MSGSPEIRRILIAKGVRAFGDGFVSVLLPLYLLELGLGPLDVGLIYFRRHLAQRARDYQRLGGARGALKSPPRAGVPS